MLFDIMRYNIRSDIFISCKDIKKYRSFISNNKPRACRASLSRSPLKNQ